MRSDKQRALKLRLSGRSYNEISGLLRIPKSTLSGWFTGLHLSQNARDRIQKRVYSGALLGLIKRNKNQTHLAVQRMRNTRSQSRAEIQHLNPEALKFIGVALYWAEGYKRPQIRGGRELTYHAVSLTNSDPFLVMLFIKFLRGVCKVPNEKITASVRLYEHMNEGTVTKFWQKVTSIPRENFGKLYYGISKSSQGKRPFTRLPYGTIQIRVNDTILFHKIMGWIEGVANQAGIV